MCLLVLESLPKPRLKALLEHFGRIEDPREPWRVAHPLPEVLLLVVCGAICDCDDYDLIAEWGERNLSFLRAFLPYHHGVPGGRWLTLLMNRINPALFAAAFTAWVRANWPDRPEFVAIDGKTSRRSHDRAAGAPPLHLVSAFATTTRLVLGQEAVPDKASETTAISALIARLAANDGLKGALVSIDAIATNPDIAGAIRAAGADYLLAVKANQPGLKAEIERLFDDPASTALDIHHDVDKGHGRIEQRTVTVAREVDWLDGRRRFPGETRLPGVASLIRVSSRTELRDRAASTPASMSPRPSSTPHAPPRPCAATGRSKTASTGCSTSSSPTISRACAKATAPTTWPSCATSPSILSELLRSRRARPARLSNASPGLAQSPNPEASSSDAKWRLGTAKTSKPHSANSHVNPDSLPWAVKATPSLLRAFDQLEHHGERRPVRQAPL